MSIQIKNNPGNIRLLMLLSQLLLAGFLCYWLSGQYRENKAVFTKDLSVQFDKARRQIIDSEVLKVLVKPNLKEMSMGSQMNVGFVVKDNRYSNPNSPFTTIRKVESSSTISGPPKSGSRVIVHRNTDGATDSFIVKGIEMMIKNTRDLADSTRNKLSQGDTAKIINLFRRDLAKSGLVLVVQWAANPTDTAGKQFLYLEQARGFNWVKITGHRSYLLKKIIPQGLFALVLLGLTGIAFLVTYRSLKQQTYLAQIRNSFIANISHELKTPVATVKVALEALADPEVLNDAATAKDYVGIATMESARLEGLIQQTLYTTLPEKAKIKLYTEPVALDQLIEATIKSLSLRTRQMNAVINTEFTAANYTIEAERLQVQGVLYNLLDNALKYGGDNTRILIKMNVGEDGIKIAVTDNGPGIPAVYLNKVFDQFFRVPSGNIHDVKGYGLGLSYAKQVMQQHHGAINVRNNESSKGCTFILSFKRMVA